MKKIYSIILLLFTVLYLSAQSKFELSDKILNQRGEICFSFKTNSKDIFIFTEIISIDKFDGKTVIAYANREEFNDFLKTNKEYTIIEDYIESSKAINMASSIDAMANWDKYPTYEVYVAMMQKFATDFPEICKLDTIGYSVNNRLLLAVKISDNVNIEEAEPEFFYTGQIHGNELIGGILFLLLIDYLLKGYGTNSQVTELVNNLQIYINPLSNPDGTYFGGNSNVTLSTRYNANFIDLNRNFPRMDAESTNIQQEIQLMINYANSHNFIMSCNSHAGAEVINYPYDAISNLPADANWWELVSREYATNVHNNSNSGYFSDLDNGVTHGYAWYSIAGGRQDYMNFFQHCREVTLELTSTKLVDSNLIPYYWNANRKALLDYMQQATYGLRGMITDFISGEAIAAKIYVENHDSYNSYVFSNPIHGDYYRLLFEGNYVIQYSADGYIPQQINIDITNYQQIIKNIQLVRIGSASIDTENIDIIKIYPNPTNTFVKIESKCLIDRIILKDILNRTLIDEKISNNKHSLYLGNYPQGTYMINLIIDGKILNTKIIKE